MKSPELYFRYTYNNRLHSICWHMEGRQFVCSYSDGALVTWNMLPKTPQTPNKPHAVVFPHGKKNKETGKVEPCDPIEKVSSVPRSPKKDLGDTPCIEIKG